MDPKKFLELAKLLATGNPREAYLRTATSRAYYAAHHVGAQAMSSMGFQVIAAGRRHSDVPRMLQNSGDSTLVSAGSQLANLYTSRLKADYELTDVKTENQVSVRAHVRQAEKIVEAIQQSCSGTNKQNIIQAIKAWKTLTGN